MSFFSNNYKASDNLRLENNLPMLSLDSLNFIVYIIFIFYNN